MFEAVVMKGDAARSIIDFSKKRKLRYHYKYKIKGFLTSNSIERISKPRRSRLLEFRLNTYTYEEFSEIAVKLLEEKYGHDRELSMTIAHAVWNEMQSKDVRNVIALGKLATSVEDVYSLVQTMKKYGSTATVYNSNQTN
jgi:hypothetical protein